MPESLSESIVTIRVHIRVLIRVLIRVSVPGRQVLFAGNLAGLVFARSIHYQFYTW